jgi:hypothetical protein
VDGYAASIGSLICAGRCHMNRPEYPLAKAKKKNGRIMPAHQGLQQSAGVLIDASHVNVV